jgi:hypothetical protein
MTVVYVVLVGLLIAVPGAYLALMLVMLVGRRLAQRASRKAGDAPKARVVKR